MTPARQLIEGGANPVYGMPGLGAPSYSTLTYGGGPTPPGGTADMSVPLMAGKRRRSRVQSRQQMLDDAEVISLITHALDALD